MNKSFFPNCLTALIFKQYYILLTENIDQRIRKKTLKNEKKLQRMANTWCHLPVKNHPYKTLTSHMFFKARKFKCGQLMDI